MPKSVVLKRGATTPSVALKTSWVLPISELDIYLLVMCYQGCRQIVLQPSKGAANQIKVEKHWSMSIKL